MNIIKNVLGINEKATQIEEKNTMQNQDDKDQNSIHIDYLLNEAKKWHPSKLLATQEKNTESSLSSFWSNTNETNSENVKNNLYFIQYLEDLRIILNMPNGAGERVVKHWLGAAWNGYPLSLTQNTCPQLNATNSHDSNAQLSLLNYCLERRAEISLANPLALVRLNLLEAKELSKEFMRSE